LQEWCFTHNAMADQAAVLANQSRDASFWDLHDRHCGALAAIGYYNRLVQNVQLLISREVVRGEKPVQLEADPEPAPEETLRWTTLPSLQIPAAAVRWYGDSIVRSIVSWFWQGVADGGDRPMWISHFQLYADYMLATGLPGPVRLQPEPLAGWTVRSTR
jgi:hypothetical protein